MSEDVSLVASPSSSGLGLVVLAPLSAWVEKVAEVAGAPA
jgi:hypothetical protein